MQPINFVPSVTAKMSQVTRCTLNLVGLLLVLFCHVPNASLQQPQISSNLAAINLVRLTPNQATSVPTNSTRSNRQAGASQLSQLRSRWRQLDLSLGDSIASISKDLNSTLNDLLYSSDISHHCKSALYDFTDSLRSQRLWAVQLLDSSAHLPSGLLSGTLTDYGNFDECLSVAEAQYCTIQARPPLPQRPKFHTICQKTFHYPLVSNNASGTSKKIAQNNHYFYYAGIRMGICVPGRCNQRDLQVLLSNYLAKYELIGQVKSCQNAQGLGLNSSAPGGLFSSLTNHWDQVQTYIACTFAALMALVFIGTIVDSVRFKQNKKIQLELDKQARTWHYQLQQPAPHQLHVGLQWNPINRDKLLINSNRKSSADDVESSPMSLSDVVDLESNKLHHQKPIGSSNKTSAAGSSLLLVDDSRQRRRRRCDLLNGSSPQNVVILPRPASNCGAGWLEKVVACFSLKHTLKALAADSRTNDIGPVHGIRTLSMFWIIFGHSVGLVLPDQLNNLFQLAQLSCSSRLLQAILNATLAVDTFFMLGGLVTIESFVQKCTSSSELILATGSSSSSRSRLSRLSTSTNTSSSSSLESVRRPHLKTKKSPQELQDSSNADSSSIDSCTSSRARCVGSAHHDATGASGAGKFKEDLKSSKAKEFRPFLWILLRYMRLTPTYAATIALAIFVPALSSGPMWNETAGAMAPNCRQYFWTNLLYANNFVETEHICLIHSWYLSNDFQFFLIAIALIYLAYKSLKLALAALIVLLVGSSAITFSLTVTNDFPPTIVTTSPITSDRWLFIHSLYYKPWPHLPPYLVGLLAGYLLQFRDRIKMSQTSRIFAWILASLVGASLLNSIYPWNMGLQVDPSITGLHSATFRTLWAACVAWLVFALVNKPSSLLARLLAWRGFQLTSRLTYCSYLIHPLIIFVQLGTQRERMDSSPFACLQRFLSTLTLTYLAAVVLTALVESPTIRLQHLLIGKFIKSPDERKEATTSRRDKQAKLIHADLASYADSWSASSSFADARADGAKGEQPRDSFKMLSTSSGSLVPQAPQMPVSQPTESGLVCKHPVDANFQQKLEQAIGRGFRIRTKLATGGDMDQVKKPAPIPVLLSQPPVAGCSSHRKELSTFGSRRSSAGQFSTSFSEPVTFR